MKIIKVRILIYTIAFIVTAGLTYIFAMDNPISQESTSSMSSAGLPVVYMETDGGIKYNYLYGYTGEVDQILTRDSITPIDSSRNIEIYIKQYSSAVSGISYEVRSLDGDDLIERSTLSDYSSSNGIIYEPIQLKNLLEDNTEYMLKIIVSSEKYGDVIYYTRIIVMENANLDMKLQYVMDFSEATLEDDTLSDISSKIYTNSTEDNTNLGRVNINSKLSQVGFGDLEPIITSDIYPTINEIDGNIASITLNYEVETEEELLYYNVKEYYRINQVDDTLTYVYNFDRWMDQIFDPINGVDSDGDIYLGITSDLDIQLKVSESGNIISFVRENTLWEYNQKKEKFIQVFSFSEEDSDGIRENNDAHGIKILEVDNDGNIKYCVYGYMNRGLHEGDLGISVFSYSVDDNVSSELIYLPRSDNYELIEQDINTLFYMNEDNILYFYRNSSIYYLDCNTKEYMIVSGDVLQESCKISDDIDVLLYEKQSDNNSVIMNILYLETGVKSSYEPTDGRTYKALGFIDGIIVYGMVDNDMIYVGEDGYVVYPMYKIILMDEDQEVIREYQQNDIYVSSVSIEGSKILLNQIQLDENLNIIATESDEILSNYQEDIELASIIEKTDEQRQKEKYIQLYDPIYTTVSNVSKASYLYTSESSVYISVNQADISDYFYAYGFGELYTFGTDLATVIQGASDSGGIVVDGDMNVIWTRYKSSEHSIDISELEINLDNNAQIVATDILLELSGSNISSQTLYDEGYSTLEILNQTNKQVLNLSGADVELIEYILDNNHAIMAKTDLNEYEVIYGYSSVGFYTLDCISGITKSYTTKELRSLLDAQENIMFAIGD